MVKESDMNVVFFMKSNGDRKCDLIIKQEIHFIIAPILLFTFTCLTSPPYRGVA